MRPKARRKSRPRQRVRNVRVAASGRIRWKSAMVTINHALEGELIGIKPGDGMRRVCFSDVSLGSLDDEQPSLGSSHHR